MAELAPQAPLSTTDLPSDAPSDASADIPADAPADVAADVLTDVQRDVPAPVTAQPVAVSQEPSAAGSEKKASKRFSRPPVRASSSVSIDSTQSYQMAAVPPIVARPTPSASLQTTIKDGVFSRHAESLQSRNFHFKEPAGFNFQFDAVDAIFARIDSEKEAQAAPPITIHGLIEMIFGFHQSVIK